MNLENEHTKNSLVVNIQCFDNVQRASIDIIYRVTYKTSSITYNFKASRSSPKNEKVIIEANLKKSNITTPKRLKASEIMNFFFGRMDTKRNYRST